MAKIKENQFPSIRVTDKLREETDKAAEIVDEKTFGIYPQGCRV